MTTPRLILASASPRRRDLLHQLRLPHDVEPASIDEGVVPGESPTEHVRRLALEKARAVAEGRDRGLVLGGDTVVVCDGDILGKPNGSADAIDMLLALQGRTHEVLSGLALVEPSPQGARHWSRVDRTRVEFRPFDRAIAAAYVATGEPLDKAGAYGIQGLGGALVTAVDGDYTTVVGLSISGLLRLLDEAGWSYSFGRLVRHEPGREEAT